MFGCRFPRLHGRGLGTDVPDVSPPAVTGILGGQAQNSPWGGVSACCLPPLRVPGTAAVEHQELQCQAQPTQPKEARP